MERVVRLHRDGPDRRVVLLETARGPDKGTGRAEAGDEVCHSPFRLLQDLDRGAVVVRLRVRRVRILVGIEVAVGLRGHQLAHEPDRAVRPFARIAVDHLGSVGADQRLAFGADVRRHH